MKNGSDGGGQWLDGREVSITSTLVCPDDCDFRVDPVIRVNDRTTMNTSLADPDARAEFHSYVDMPPTQPMMPPHHEAGRRTNEAKLPAGRPDFLNGPVEQSRQTFKRTSRQCKLWENTMSLTKMPEFHARWERTYQAFSKSANVGRPRTDGRSQASTALLEPSRNW